MNIIHLEADTVSLHGNGYTQLTRLPLYGIEDDRIADIDAVGISIKRLVAKHEQRYGIKIESVTLVCDICELDIQRHGRIREFNPHKNRMVTNKFAMQTCNAFEIYKADELKDVIKLLAEICITVEKVFSVFGLFITNAREIINHERIAVINFRQSTTLTCFFDGSGSLQEFRTYNHSINKCLEYVTSAAVSKFPYLRKNTDVIGLVLQDFVNLSEVEMVAKINNNKQYKKEVISLVNYEMAHFISGTVYGYCSKMWEEMGISQNFTKIFVHSNTKYVKIFVMICDLLSSQYIAPMEAYIRAPVQAKPKTSLFNEIIKLLKVS